MPLGRKESVTQPGKIDKYRTEAVGTTSGVAWADVHAQSVINVLTAATSVGDSVMFGRTSDGGALMLTVYSNGVKDPMYWHSADDATIALDEMHAALIAYVRLAGSKDEKRALGLDD